MATRQAILEKVRSAISNVSDVKKNDTAIPPLPEVWDTEGLPLNELSARFQTNLESVKGEFVSCENVAQAVAEICGLIEKIGAKKIAVMERPLCRTIAGQLSNAELVFPPKDPANVSAEELSVMDAGLVSPEYLLSDTGSCLFVAPVAFDRLTTYITPVSIVVAEESMLRENLPAVWKEMEPRLKAATTGEFVIVTGPSRTADIEKILILGVHGPRRVIVFLIKQQ